ncbi:UNVERIFIED_CONTAM: hypothetical protein RMT77_014450 [Armadillidium vulgare]
MCQGTHGGSAHGGRDSAPRPRDFPPGSAEQPTQNQQPRDAPARTKPRDAGRLVRPPPGTQTPPTLTDGGHIHPRPAAANPGRSRQMPGISENSNTYPPTLH